MSKKENMLPVLPKANEAELDSINTGGGNFHKSLKIFHPMAQLDTDVKLELGDFYYVDDLDKVVNLGKKVNAIVLDRRYGLAVNEYDGTPFIEAKFMPKFPYFNTDEMDTFCNKYDLPLDPKGWKKYNGTKTRDHKLNFGMEFLVYLPEVDDYFQFWAKGALNKSNQKMVSMAETNPLMEIETVKKIWAEKKLTWTELKLKSLDNNEFGYSLDKKRTADAVETYKPNN